MLLEDILIIIVLCGFALCFLVWIKDFSSCNCKKQAQTSEDSSNTAATTSTCTREQSNQTTDIWNISSRVNHQDGPVTSEPHRWPTHDHHVSIDSFVMPEHLQSHKKDRVPPPPYCEVDLPTYEQATGVPNPKDDLAPVHISPSSSRNYEEPRS